MTQAEWIKIHGSTKHTKPFERLGWPFTPVQCECPKAHTLDDLRTGKRKR